MMISIRTVDQLDVKGKRVFYRVDYNVPLENGEVSDTTRIDETMRTLKLLRARGARVVLASHLGRPKGKRNEKYSLAPVRAKLAAIAGADVKWASDCIGDEAKQLSLSLAPGELLLVENLRFHEGEEKNDAAFAAGLRELADCYVNDAFGASHRAHASIVALPELFGPDKCAGGFLLQKEVEFLQKVTNVSERPFVAVLGGAKIAGKIEPLEVMVKLADRVLVGGGMANTFLAAQGHPMGASLVDKDSIEVAKRILDAEKRAEVMLPEDVIVTDSLDNPTKTAMREISGGLREGEMAVDIGARTLKRFVAAISEAKTIFWNGPMGVFEKDAFAGGTRGVARAVAEANAISIVGGGESVEAVKESGYASRISHISTGGGASLEFISGASLPGIEILRVR
jgi:phosphoglycerate kinase